MRFVVVVFLSSVICCYKCCLLHICAVITKCAITGAKAGNALVTFNFKFFIKTTVHTVSHKNVSFNQQNSVL